MRYFGVSLGSLLLSASAYAQSKGMWGGAGWFMGGYTIIRGYEGFSKTLQDAGLSYPSTATAFTVGGGGGSYLGRLFLGGQGEFIFGDRLTGGSGVFLLGSPLRIKEQFIFLPALGVGGGGYTFQLEGRPSSASFQQAVSSPGILPRELSTGGAIGEVVLSFQYLFRKGPLVGLQLGYLRALGSMKEWDSGGLKLNEGPSITPERFFARLSFGAGGIVTPTTSE
ncbi:MAG: hypothetical protein RMJ66_01460 [Bacteroidia bacterium]|nr:hypothetical protein [Bacteroidia bacterium]MDW8133712.1 hypothetical protein [Bacteroidia bacterium]